VDLHDHGMDKWWAAVDAVMNFQVRKARINSCLGHKLSADPGGLCSMQLLSQGVQPAHNPQLATHLPNSHLNIISPSSS
jgi:hypothetical protein